ncbi:Lrp/AsnC family transcriptional regulator [Nocardiopsis changdeensis]|uniref:Lrp/AsnC family transcriptional regulator n=1 Tax=Nocardiopsis changdeensis TaxID=2831969 RepID=A0ABX8BU41_9ACTN|nr:MULTISPECIES: Lrp/AsnC family transcriptional regulator [Nocardiopsis]QUX25599.1 Lrp/AsnC family transcriptional regulator [Nocardiopsis changdeensis]QYX35985.1 Lrp/AsnC family transcriptional regulator [Nocardiopsis sp. MT53]
MDELDSAIVRELQRDARQTNRALAAKLGVAPSTCLERVRLLRRRGVVRGFHADIDPQALGRRVQAFVSVQLRPPSRRAIEGFKAAMHALPEVSAVYVVAGEHDFLVHVSAPSLDALHSFLIDRLTERREVAGFRSQIIYDSVVKTVAEPLEPGTG